MEVKPLKEHIKDHMRQIFKDAGEFTTEEEFAQTFEEEFNSDITSQTILHNLIIEFTKAHVQAAKEEIANTIQFDENEGMALIRQSVLQAYPLENIK